MTDTDAIAALVHEYAARIDAGDLDGVAELLAGATWRSSARAEAVRGREAIRRLYDDVVLYDGRPCTKHLVTNLVVRVAADGVTASARSSFTVLQARPGFALQPIIAGRYEDRFARTAAGWHFADRLIVPELVGDLSRHLRSAAPAPVPGGRAS
jgi:ketosteroid isomerase-like protein